MNLNPKPVRFTTNMPATKDKIKNIQHLLTTFSFKIAILIALFILNIFIWIYYELSIKNKYVTRNIQI